MTTATTMRVEVLQSPQINISSFEDEFFSSLELRLTSSYSWEEDPFFRASGFDVSEEIWD